MKIIFATNNLHKLQEIRLAIPPGYEIVSLAEYHINEDIPETRDTLEGNAIEKATYIYKKVGVACFADDTGLEVEALNGRPGVYSARYAGPSCNFEDNIEKLLSDLLGIENRNARFRTVIAYYDGGEPRTFEGEINGSIIKSRKGTHGFGYDPVFLPENSVQTFAEMPMELKNSISHRARALNKFILFLEDLNKHYK